jgi:hypothetical protein
MERHDSHALRTGRQDDRHQLARADQQVNLVHGEVQVAGDYFGPEEAVGVPNTPPEPISILHETRSTAGLRGGSREESPGIDSGVGSLLLRASWQLIASESLCLGGGCRFTVTFAPTGAGSLPRRACQPPRPGQDPPFHVFGADPPGQRREADGNLLDRVRRAEVAARRWIQRAAIRKQTRPEFPEKRPERLELPSSDCVAIPRPQALGDLEVMDKPGERGPPRGDYPATPNRGRRDAYRGRAEPGRHQRWVLQAGADNLHLQQPQTCGCGECWIAKCQMGQQLGDELIGEPCRQWAGEDELLVPLALSIECLVRQ